jgi:hypothetical protein
MVWSADNHSEKCGVIEGAYEVLGIFDRVDEKRDAMQSLALPAPARHALANAALKY